MLFHSSSDVSALMTYENCVNRVFSKIACTHDKTEKYQFITPILSFDYLFRVFICNFFLLFLVYDIIKFLIIIVLSNFFPRGE